MPYAHAIIPRSIAGFNQYIRLTCTHIVLGSPVTNAIRYNWTIADIDAWLGFQDEWLPKYLLYINKKAGYTTNIKNELMNIIANAVSYDKSHKLILKVKATVDLTVTDCSIFRIPISYVNLNNNTNAFSNNTVVNKTIVSTEAVYPRIKAVGGGFLEIEGYTEKAKSGRAHKPEGFDLLEYAVAVFYSGTGNLPLSAGDARLTISHSSKASFILQTAAMTANLPLLAEGELPTAKLAVLFFRWAKSKHPELDGPWSGPFITVIL